MAYSAFDREFSVDMEESKWWFLKAFGVFGDKVIEFLENLFK